MLKRIVLGVLGFVSLNWAYADSIEEAISALSSYSAVQNAVKVQDPDLASAMRKALLAASVLIDQNGHLDVGSVSAVQAAFIPEAPEDWEVNMGKVLAQLDASWEPIFDAVHVPASANQSSTLALRALFSLGSNQPLTDRHARIAVLAALFAPYNQGPVGDCFAVNDLIRDHEEYFRHAAKDYASLVTNGYLERIVNGNPDYFFFLPILPDLDRAQSFGLTQAGSFPNTSYTLFDAPGFAAARTLMGGDGIPTLTQEVVSALSSHGANGQLRVTPAQVIAALAHVIAVHSGQSNTASLVALGEYAFSCLTNQPILRGVEAAFAAMAEDRPNDSTRGNVNACVNQALQTIWTSLRSYPQIKLFQETFFQNFNASYRLFYQLDIPLPQVSADGSSSDGGYQLYQRVSGNPTLLGARIVTPQDFRNLVLTALTISYNQLAKVPNMATIFQKLNSYIRTDDFLKQALWAYDPANRKEPNPVQNYMRLNRTPMQSCDGDNPFEVDDLDTGANYDSHVQSFQPNNAQDLITWCLNLAKTAPLELIPMDSPQHAFNFAPTNPDIAAFLKKGMPISQWLQNMLFVPGMQISRKIIDLPTQQAIGQGMVMILSQVLPNPSSLQAILQTLSQSHLTVKDYSNQLINGVIKLLHFNTAQAKELALLYDGLLIQSLNANDQTILNQSAIRFALTNWNQGAKDIYFCAFFNPRTEQVGFGTIVEDKTQLQPMDEDAWVNHQQWDVDLMPYAPTA